MEEKKENYNATSIQLLEGLEHVRLRPGMYIGSTGPTGLHHLVWEIVDNSIDEALAGFASHIEIEVLPDDVIRVTDNGRGMPVDIHPKTNRPAIEAIFTVLNAGGKYDTEVALINQLSDLIDAGRETNDQDERAAIYSRALDIVMQLAIELPTYQRNDLFAYNTNKIDVDSLTPDANLSPYKGLTSDLHLVSLVVEK